MQRWTSQKSQLWKEFSHWLIVCSLTLIYIKYRYTMHDWSTEIKGKTYQVSVNLETLWVSKVRYFTVMEELAIYVFLSWWQNLQVTETLSAVSSYLLVVVNNWAPGGPVAGWGTQRPQYRSILSSGIQRRYLGPYGNNLMIFFWSKVPKASGLCTLLFACIMLISFAYSWVFIWRYQNYFLNFDINVDIRLFKNVM